MDFLYEPLFTVSVEHQYFSDGVWKELIFVPHPETQRIADGVGMLFRQMGNGIAAFRDVQRGEGGYPDADPARFVFKVYVKDRSFANYTSPAIELAKRILYFENQPGDAGDGTLLSKGDVVSTADCREIAELAAEGVLDGRDCRVPPDFVVSIRIGRGADATVPAYRLRFDTRRSFWLYYLLGNMNRIGSYIVDLDNRVEFESHGEAMLPGNRPSRVFRSKERVPLLETSNYRFQLREQGTGREKILIKRLPAASELRLGQGLIDGRKEIVLENYVNY